MSPVAAASVTQQKDPFGGAIVQPALRSCPPELLTLLQRFPAQSPPLIRTWTDLSHAAKWEHLDVLDLSGEDKGKTGATIGWAAIRGLRPEMSKREVVVPCLVKDTLTTSHFNALFAAVDALEETTQEGVLETERSHILISVLSPDGTVVYYKLAKGLVKPVN